MPCWIADDFTKSAEFQSHFGSLTNQQFVEKLYHFALGRTGDAQGVQNWVDVLNNGISRARVVLDFSESAEHVNLTLNLAENGAVYAGYAVSTPSAAEENALAKPPTMIDVVTDTPFVSFSADDFLTYPLAETPGEMFGARALATDAHPSVPTSSRAQDYVMTFIPHDPDWLTIIHPLDVSHNIAHPSLH